MSHEVQVVITFLIKEKTQPAVGNADMARLQRVSPAAILLLGIWQPLVHVSAAPIAVVMDQARAGAPDERHQHELGDGSWHKEHADANAAIRSLATLTSPALSMPAAPGCATIDLANSQISQSTSPESSSFNVRINVPHFGYLGIIQAPPPTPPNKGLALRFPRFLRNRPDKSVREATSTEELGALFRAQGGRGS